MPHPTATLRLIPCLLAVLVLAGLFAPSAVNAEEENPAVSILRDLEEKNKDLETLHGTFIQVRQNRMFDEEISSRGEFWYSQPNKFRANYSDPSPYHFWMIGNMIHSYTPEIKQVERFRVQQSGDDAPINSMLVGFGMDTNKILDVFTVRVIESESDDSRVAIEFNSKNTDRTLEFQTITVWFDRENLTPQRMHMQEIEDEVTIDLTEVRVNADVAPSVFELNFPEDTTVVEM